MPPSIPPDDARARQRLDWARTATGRPDLALSRASMDAGFRSYWRATVLDAPSLVVMDSPPALEDVRPWLRVHALLDGGGVRVPRVLAEDVDAGFLLLEDLGTATCLQALETGDPDTLFDAALDQLLLLQAIACPSWLPAYDARMLMQELRLFDEWYLGRHLGVSLDDVERASLARAYDALVDAALAQPTVLVHRDFMLRNLMPVDDGVAVLDFQDAVRGPIAYDLLSLCKDAFTSWPDEVVASVVARYHSRAAAANLPVGDPAAFARDLDWIGVQRHLKVLGIFARLHHRDGKPKYLEDAPRFLAYLEAVLPRHPALAPLLAIIRRHAAPVGATNGAAA